MTRVTQRQLDAYAHFLAAGMHEKGAAAPVGNFVQESGENLDSTMFRAHPDASGGVREDLKSGGIAEWLGGRKTAYIAFSQKSESVKGLSAGSLLNDLHTQCDFCLHELTSDREYWTLYQQLTTDTVRSIATLTANFMEIYERPKAGPTAGLQNRIEHAEAVYERAQLIKKAQDGQPRPPEPIPEPPLPLPQIPVPPPSTAPAGLPPISSSAAGRQAAIRDALDEIGAGYRAELEAYRKEMNDMVDAAIAAIPMSSAAGPLALPKPPAIPAATRSPIMNGNAKPAIASTGVWGGIIAMGVPLLGQLAAYMGTSIDPRLQLAGTVIGGLLAIYGRVTATGPVTGVLKS